MLFDGECEQTEKKGLWITPIADTLNNPSYKSEFIIIQCSWMQSWFEGMNNRIVQFKNEWVLLQMKFNLFVQSYPG